MTPKKNGLYDPANEHDACGVGFVVNIDGNRNHTIVHNGVTILKNLVHRGAVGGDHKTGDGAGMLTQIPHKFLVKACAKKGIKIPDEGTYGAAQVFLPEDIENRIIVVSIIETSIYEEGATLLGWRDVPADASCLGVMARSVMPHFMQLFVTIGTLSGDALERKLFILRKAIEKRLINSGYSIESAYFPSFSSRTIVYKGMLVAEQFEIFYADLADPDFESAIALVHQRYSTNTFPSWPLAHPFRYIAHNGEINTLRGNVNKMKARQAQLESPLFGSDIEKISPVITPNLSDSGSFDNALELVVQGGRTIDHALSMMVPEAFGAAYHMSQDKRSYYEYHAAVMEPWDGPAAVAFTDGVRVGATLDRNGLRPGRYTITKSGMVVLASETGVLEIDPADVLQKGRLAPGKMFMVDTAKKRVIFDNEIKAQLSRQKPYRKWLESNVIQLKGLFQEPEGFVNIDNAKLVTDQKAFGYTTEEISMIIAAMAEDGQEPINSMGIDTPLSILSEQPQLLYSYFKQLFAQVTNPPIDPYRENLVMSLMSFIGREGNLLVEAAERCKLVKLPHPVLTNEDMKRLKNLTGDAFKSVVVDALFNIDGDAGKNLTKAIDLLCTEVEKAIDSGVSLIILSDKNYSKTMAPIPMLLAVSAVHQYLIKAGKRQLAGLVVESGEARDVMHFGTLIGFGASAVNPYTAFETIADLYAKGKIASKIKSVEDAFDNYIHAIKKGLLKIMSKMGISTIRSYRGAQIFEAVGLNSEFVEKYFTDTASRIEGIGTDGIARETLTRFIRAYEERTVNDCAISSGGNIHYRRASEKHLLTPESIVLVQKAVRESSYETYKKYAEAINDKGKNLCTIRGLFNIKAGKPVSIDEVEPVENIVKRFVTSAMSFGSISKEAHETMAIAMNRIGGMSNSGEGGEDEARYIPLPNGDSAKSTVKQVASGRFGVTINYLTNSNELQIKMAQGAKPGEGGQLPGHKVNETIAKVRHSTPGVMLISPPPHHDIYSIEDLAQLIFDLKNSNPKARVSVKLVSEVGVGTVAAGVVKGKADMVLIAGHDGGTGASPISSIRHAGCPWEIGLAETQQTLVLNKLRSRVRVQADGKMKTGRDIVIAALLGAEEYGFGTLSLITLGCVMMRKCHLNTCPVGVATQDPKLRAKFAGKPEHVINFMKYVAQDVREHMAALGFRTMDEMIGRVDMLDTNQAISHWKAQGLDFSAILAVPEVKNQSELRCTEKQDVDWQFSIDNDLIEKAKPALDKKESVKIISSIRNCNRTVGTTLSHEIAKRYGSAGLPDETIHIKFTGSAGQSFGAFLSKGVTLELEGDANDYVGKGLSGGRIIVYPHKNSTFRPQDNVVSGNVNLFGATSGELFINGMAGERFCVRNSGATAVVEGVGDHGCEYMTGGTVVILGRTGVNFAAGMSGGIAFVLDDNQLFDTRCNLEMVDLEPVSDPKDQELLKTLIEKHVKYTNSQNAAAILRDWIEMLPQFVKVMPVDYKKVLDRRKAEESKNAEVDAMTEEVRR